MGTPRKGEAEGKVKKKKTQEEETASVGPRKANVHLEKHSHSSMIRTIKAKGRDDLVLLLREVHRASRSVASPTSRRQRSRRGNTSSRMWQPCQSSRAIIRGRRLAGASSLRKQVTRSRSRRSRCSNSLWRQRWKRSGRPELSMQAVGRTWTGWWHSWARHSGRVNSNATCRPALAACTWKSSWPCSGNCTCVS